MILVSLVVLMVLVGPFVLLYGCFLIWRPERLKSAERVRFGVIGGTLVSMISAVGGIVVSTRAESISTLFGTVRPIAFVDVFAFGVVLGMIVCVGATVLLLWSGRE